MKILVAVDEAQLAGDLVRAMVTVLRAESTEVRVLHVLQPVSTSPPPQMAADYAPELESQKQERQELVQQVAAQLRDGGFQVEGARVEIGDVKQTIVDSAEQWGADLIVLGSHSRTGIQRLLLGSVAEGVVRHAKCSVQVVRQRPPH